MTQVGINWAQYLESRRHNLETERLSGKDIEVKQGSLGETIRHNIVSEGLTARDVSTRQRAQNLNEQIYKTVTLPESQSRRALMSSEQNLNRQKAIATAEQAKLYTAQKLTESVRQANYQADTALKQSNKAKVDVEARTASETADARIKAQNLTNQFAGNPVVGTIKDVFSTLGSLVRVRATN